MTTSKIAQMASLLNSPDLMNTQKQTQQTDLAFGAFLSQTSGNTRQEFLSSDSMQKAVESTGKQTAYERETARAGYREESISRSQAADGAKELPDDAAEKIKAFEKQVKETVAKELGVSEEEVAEQMQAMGLTIMDLMDPSKLASLVMELTGSEDIGGLLLNPEFQQIFTQIGELSQELAAQLGMAPEEMKQLLAICLKINYPKSQKLCLQRSRQSLWIQCNRQGIMLTKFKLLYREYVKRQRYRQEPYRMQVRQRKTSRS